MKTLYKLILLVVCFYQYGFGQLCWESPCLDHQVFRRIAIEYFQQENQPGGYKMPDYSQYLMQQLMRARQPTGRGMPMGAPQDFGTFFLQSLSEARSRGEGRRIEGLLGEEERRKGEEAKSSDFMKNMLDMIKLGVGPTPMETYTKGTYGVPSGAPAGIGAGRPIISPAEGRPERRFGYQLAEDARQRQGMEAEKQTLKDLIAGIELVTQTAGKIGTLTTETGGAQGIINALPGEFGERYRQPLTELAGATEASKAGEVGRETAAAGLAGGKFGLEEDKFAFAQQKEETRLAQGPPKEDQQFVDNQLAIISRMNQSGDWSEAMKYTRRLQAFLEEKTGISLPDPEPRTETGVGAVIEFDNWLKENNYELRTEEDVETIRTALDNFPDTAEGGIRKFNFLRILNARETTIRSR